MTYFGGKLARNTGKRYLNIAMAPRRAIATSSAVAPGLIGTTSAMASSDAINSAISRRNRSPRRRELTRRNACIETRHRTDSGVTDGKSFSVDCWTNAGTRTQPLISFPLSEAKHGYFRESMRQGGQWAVKLGCVPRHLDTPEGGYVT